MIKKLLSKVIPRSKIAKFRLGKERKKYLLYFKTLETKENFNAVYLFGTPLHTNLGDHLITIAEYSLLEKAGDKKVIEIPTEVFQSCKSDVLKIVPKDAVIYVNGGGWMGNLWPFDELFMQELVETFSNHKIIIFPQTIYYDEKAGRMYELIQGGGERYSKCEKLTLCVRDYKSYILACEYYPDTDIKLMPDIALSYSVQFTDAYEKDIVGVCLRNDRELAVDVDKIDFVKAIFETHGYCFKEVTTMSERRVSGEKREEAVKQKLKEFYKCGFIITDRLHGMIFAFLTGTPCIVFDNKTQKVSGVYKEWLSNYGNIFPIFGKVNKDELEAFIENSQGKVKCDNNFFEKMFCDLIREMGYGRN